MSTGVGKVRVLDWDSEFFGVSIGEWKGELFTPAVERDVLLQARGRSLECLFIKVPLVGNQMPQELADEIKLVDIRVVLERSLSIPTLPTPSIVEIRRGTKEDLPDLEPGIRDLARWSRFASDARFGVAAAARMYQQWAFNSCNDKDQMLLVASDHQTVAGFLALGMAPPDIGLIYSGQAHSGIGTALAQRAFVEARGRSSVITVATQERNLVALDFYKKLGFSVTARLAVYHLWMDQVPQ